MRNTVMKLVPSVLAATCLPVAAQDSFLGIPLDMPFTGVTSECPKEQGLNIVDANRIKDAGTCFLKESASRFRVYNTPDLGIGLGLTVQIYDEKPIIFEIRFNKDNYAQAVSTFTHRYGKPSRTYRETVHTRSGGSYESKTTIWDRTPLHVRLDEIGKDVRWSDGVIVNAPLLKERSRKSVEAAKAAAEKL